MKIFIFLLMLLCSSHAYAMRYVNYKALDAVTVTATSSPIQASYLSSFSVHGISTSTIFGSFKVQASNDPISVVGGTPGNFVDISPIAMVLPAGGSVMLTATASTYNWLQVVFTKTGGTGTVTTQFQGQGLE